MEAQYIEITKYGDKRYYKDRKMNILHRTDGPAIEHSNGHKAWIVDGKLHRSDGPAIEHADGPNEWFINGKKLTEEEFNKLTAPEVVLTMDEIAAKLGVDVSKLKIKK